MKCKDCRKNIVGDEFRKVADWVFCPSYFDKLLAKAEKDASPEPAASPADTAVQPDPEDVAKCTTCGCDIAENQGNKVGIWLFWTKLQYCEK